MRPLPLAFVVLACTLAAVAQIPAPEYAARRQALQKSLGDSVLVLFGNTTQDVDELRTPFYQEPNFQYLTGWVQPGAILLLTADSEIFFLPRRSEAVERYTGRKVAPGDDDAAQATGFARVLPLAQFESGFAAELEKHQNVLTLKDRRHAARLEKLTPMREVRDAARLIARLRGRKSAAEIALLERATEVSMEAHRAAWKRIAPGLFEYQVAASMEFVMRDRNCRPGYTSIVGAGPNGAILHYSENARRMDAGELILMDVAAACGDYTSDITRTVPVNGKFSPRQRELYLAVLGAQKAAVAAVKPGATMQSINQAAKDYLEEHGKLGKYLTHGISHGVGLEAHDAPSHLSTEPFEPGMVITLEPGVYLPEEKLGIRIEDVVLVTADGARVLSAALAKEPQEIERAMADRPPAPRTGP